MTSRSLYYTCKQIIETAGMPVPVQERDPFSIMEKGIEFNDYNIGIEWAKTLGGDSHGRIIEMSRIFVYVIEEDADPEEFFDEETLGLMSEDTEFFSGVVVFDAILTNTGMVDTFCMVPGEWMKQLDEIHNSLIGSEKTN